MTNPAVPKDSIIFYISGNQKAKEYAIGLFKNICPTELCEPHYWPNDSDPIYWAMYFEKDVHRDIRIQKFKDEVIKTLDIILPKLVATKESIE